LIADFVARGKRVLFVCEKRAALDVVFYRLKQSGLDTLCCLIHDSQTDKKSFIADLKRCYEEWIQKESNLDDLSYQRAHLVNTLNAYQNLLDGFEREMQVLPEAMGHSVRVLLRRIADLSLPPSADAALREQLPSVTIWDQQRDFALRLHKSMRERFGLDSIAGHPFAYLSANALLHERAYANLQQLCEQLETWFERWQELLEREDGLITENLTLAKALAYAQECQNCWTAVLLHISRVSMWDMRVMQNCWNAVQNLDVCMSNCKPAKI